MHAEVESMCCCGEHICPCVRPGLLGESNNRFARSSTSDRQSTESGTADSQPHTDSTSMRNSLLSLDNADLIDTTQPHSAPTSALGATATSVDSASAGSAQAVAADGEKPKKGHRRGRSLTGLIPTLKTKPKRSQSQLSEVPMLCCAALRCAVLCCPALCCAALGQLTLSGFEPLLPCRGMP